MKSHVKNKISQKFYFCEVPKKASIYTGVYWNKGCKKWQAQLKNKGKNYCEYFDIEEHAAMKINLLCDKIEIERKNPEINIDGIQKVINSLLMDK